MPYVCEKVGSKWHLKKKDGGDSLGSHSSKLSCTKQMRAVYANEMKNEKNIVINDLVYMPWNFDEKIKEADKEIKLIINSRGGSFYDAMLMHNKLRNSGKRIIGYIESIAYSAGAILVLACDEVYIPENGLIMLHMPKVFFNQGTEQDANNVESLLAMMRAQEEILINTVSSKIKKTAEETRAFLEKETYLTANEALELGIVTEIVPIMRNIEVENSFPERIITFVNQVQTQFKEENIEMALKEVCEQFGVDPTDDALVAFIKKLQNAAPKPKVEPDVGIINVVKDYRNTTIDRLVSDGYALPAYAQELKVLFVNDDTIKSDFQLSDPNGHFNKSVTALQKNGKVMEFDQKTRTQRLDKPAILNQDEDTTNLAARLMEEDRKKAKAMQED